MCKWLDIWLLFEFEFWSSIRILCSWIRASWINVNNCPIRCDFIQFIIQGDAGGICNTLRNDSMFDSEQKRSYEHGSDYEWLPSYGKKKITDHPVSDCSLYYLLTPWSRVLLVKLTGLQLVKKFMEPKGSFPHSQVPATCPYPEPARSSPYPHIPLPEYPS